MIMGLSNTYTNQQSNTNQQPSGANRNSMLGSRRRFRSFQDGRRSTRYNSFLFFSVTYIINIFEDTKLL